MKKFVFLVATILVGAGIVACDDASHSAYPVPDREAKTCATSDATTFSADAFTFKLSEELAAPAEQVSVNSKRHYQTPTRQLALSEWPSFLDDLDFENMMLAIDRQLKRYSQLDLTARTIEFGGVKMSATIMRDSLIEFKALVNAYITCKAKGHGKAACTTALNTNLRQKFNVYAPDLKPGDTRYGEKNPVLFTGYYTPTLEASPTRTASKPHAIYKKPTDKLISSSRVDIDFRNILDNRGLDLFYTNSLFDLYLLHVQGGGKVNLTDSNGKRTQHYLTYDGTNGLSWRFISNYMMQKGYVANGSIEGQRRFLNNHPEKQEEIFATCPSYVYFKITNEPPHGSDVVPLTDNRSIATDTNHYLFKGAIAFVEAKRPANPYDPAEACEVGQYKAFSRFYLDQDTGGAIRGKGRVDLYFGEEPYAEVAAYNTIQRGNLYFLILKQ